MESKQYPPLNNQWVSEEIKKDYKRLASSYNQMTMPVQHTKPTGHFLGEKFIAVNPYIRKTNHAQINNLITYLKTLEKRHE